MIPYAYKHAVDGTEIVFLSNKLPLPPQYVQNHNPQT